ncbi:MAG TPA: ornithine carbamoyltransferase [Candidatus Korarchaeota archaeon]|nr:ornithine carbamoyltransferase [Candidatus Korarchaeota archaeon]
MRRSLLGRNFLSLVDYSPEEFRYLIRLSMDYKLGRRSEEPLKGKTIALIFEKPSTRTRVSISVAINELGGYPLELPIKALQVSRGETLKDTALVLSRYVHAIAARVKKHETLIELARWADIPVINMLSDKFHPLQALADVMTMKEMFEDKKLKVAFVGDGGANTSHSLMLASALQGYHHVVACPPEYQPDPSVLDRAEEIASRTGGLIEVIEDPKKAVKQANVIYTDTWVSMGMPDAERRMEVFPPYQVNKTLVSLAERHVIVMHCQPWFLGQEITEEVAYGPHSVAFEQAENRLHTAKAVLRAIMVP